MAEPPTGDLSIPATDRGTALLVVVWMCAAIAVIVVAIRFYVRTHITEKVRINDWVILLTLVRDSLFRLQVRMPESPH